MFKPGVDAQEYTAKFDNIGMTIKEPVIEEYNLWLVEYDKNRSDAVDALISVIESPEVDIAQFNHIVEERDTMPNDTRFNEMWGLHNTGQSGGTVDADIDAPEAWDYTQGGLTALGDTIVVAVVDGGFFLAHQDLNFWKNWGEIPGNSIDDDSNGYVDDVNGWNAYNSNGNITSSQHGTHVSGTVGARGNNNLGVTGVNWNMRVMAIQGSSGSEATVLRAYRYAQRQRQLYNQTNGVKGAYVVATNSSFGVDNANPNNYPLWCAYYDSLGMEGIISAGAGPNNNVNIDVVGDVPTACPSDFMLSVTNTTRNDVRNTGAGYGPIHMDIGAPGTSILSTNPNNLYGTSTGTSMATPHVAGSIGLMYAAADSSMIYLSMTQPDSVARLMKQLMMESVDTLANLSNILGKGRLNLYKSVLAVNSLIVTSVTGTNNGQPAAFDLKQNYPNPFNPTTKIDFSVPESGLVSLNIYDVSGKLVGQLVNNILRGGSYSAEFNASNLSSGIYFYTLKTGSFVQTKKMMLIK
ncbi:MAG TPA: S8/S53 family peptidase [Ignavibacteria bacterium]|nr:S8/S53 family peptidase [Ignavibacteria bacterium]